MILYYFRAKGAAVISILLLPVYWLICYYGNPADAYSLDGWFGTALDIRIFGASHLYHGEGTAFDPEDIWSVFPAISQTIFGYITGKYIIQKLTGKRELMNLFVVGLVFILVGYLWSFAFPINKKIWTSSYCVFTTGIAISFLGILIYLIEFQNIRGIFYTVFDDFGRNTLFIYCLSGLIPTICSFILIGDKHQNLWNFSYHFLFDGWQNQQLSSALFALLFVALNWLIAYYLRKKKIYIKI